MQEIDRLKLLIPEPIRAEIDIDLSPIERSLMMVRRNPSRRWQIQIDSRSWESIDIDVRNLLFWHEIARIQSGSIGSDRSAYLAIVTGLGIASIDLFTDNIGMLAAALLVSGLAGFRLYQKYLGEQNLRRLTMADREAIELAVAFGYQRQIARELLKTALQITMRKSRYKFRRDRCAARLQVLALA